MGRAKALLDGLWPTMPDVDELRTAAEARCGGAGGLSERLFLSTFAIYLVKHFRAEEARMERMKAPHRSWHRQEHHRLVRQLRDLMADLDLGFEVGPRIQRFLEGWRRHQDSVWLLRNQGGRLGN